MKAAKNQMLRIACKQRYRSRILRASVAAMLALPIKAAFAIDMDIIIDDRQRQEAITPKCAASENVKGKDFRLDNYEEGLCLLYGVHRKPDQQRALLLLRKASGSGSIEAQLALADELQKGNESSQREALTWYQRAALAGDARAAMRYDRLTQRLDNVASAKADNTLPDPPPGTIVNPSSREMQSLYSQGYHCHMMPFRQKWCHNLMD